MLVEDFLLWHERLALRRERLDVRVSLFVADEAQQIVAHVHE
jgi:hypothetical protein